jgi:pimeloyl-ACP methyl ester carboxylesterase
VPGLKPKPRPEVYQPQLLRVLLAGLARSRPAAARWLEEHAEAFVVVAWTHLFYGTYRDIALDLPGIEQLLAQQAPTEQDRRELASWPRRLKRVAHVIGDALPLLGRRLAQPATRLQMHEATRYLRNRDGIGVAIRALLRAELDAAWAAGDRVLVIGHSLGSVIAYDTLWDLSNEAAGGRVDLFVTIGSPLATRFIRRRLRGAGVEGAAAYPRNIRRWVNLSARGDTTALKPRVKPFFYEMLDLGLTESIEDHADLENYFRGSIGLNAHESYGYLAQRTLAEIVGDWLERA